LSGTVYLTTYTNYTSKQPSTYEKTRGCQRSFRLLMMGGVSPVTCWASYKFGIIKILIQCCILLDFSLWIVPWCTDPWTSSAYWHAQGLSRPVMGLLYILTAISYGFLFRGLLPLSF